MDPGMPMLREEHARILRMLDAAEAVSRRMESGESVSPQLLQDIVEFFARFAHGLHHDRETRALVPLLLERGLHQASACLQFMTREAPEHDAALSRLATAADDYSEAEPRSADGWVRAAFQYSTALRDQLRREDEVVYPAAERMLTAADHTELADRLREVGRRAEHESAEERVAGCEDRVLAVLTAN